MAVNPKLIRIAARTLMSERVRKFLLYSLFMFLGVVMVIFMAFSALISGLLSIIQDSELKNHWSYYKATIADIFRGFESSIDTDVKDEVYDFMPEFSINLSKAAIAGEFENELLLYDEDEIEQAQDIMKNQAEQLRRLNTQEAFSSFIAEYECDLSFSDISGAAFAGDSGIDNIGSYPDELKQFLYCRAMEKMPSYSYTFEKVTLDDDRTADRQTLVVASPDGSTQTVEYTCIGGGQIYLPEFLAMFHIKQSQDFFLAVQENQAMDLDSQVEDVVGGIPETAEAAGEYIQGVWDIVVNGRGAVNINVFQVTALKQLIQEANLSGAVSITTDRTTDKLSITLETVDSDVWKELFSIDESVWEYVEQTEAAIEMALDEAEIPEEERTLSLDNMVQLALFVYFEGFFELPVSSSELAPGGNAILSQCGDVSKLHLYKYGSKDHGVPEKGLTIELTGKTDIHADLLNCGSCIQDAYIYDVWNMDEQSIATDTNSQTFNMSAVTIAYIIDTDQFEQDYGFPFPAINGIRNAGTVTLFLEFSCLDSVEFDDLDIGSSIYDISDDLVVGYSHDGSYSDERDSGLWRHAINRDEYIPHVGIKTYFMAGEVTQPEPPEGVHYYAGPSVRELGTAVNPRLWFKGFRTGMSEELFDTLKAISFDETEGE